MRSFYNRIDIKKVIFLIFFLTIYTFKISYADINLKAQDQINNLMNDLIIYVKDTKINKETSKKKLIKYINLDFMARATSGKYWKTATNAEQKKYKKLLFLKIIHSINLHTKKLKNLKFIHKKTEIRGKKLVYVRGFLKNNSEKQINVIWKLYSKDLSIIDMQIEKISLIKAQKSETINLLRKYKGNFKDFLNNFKIKNVNP